jgi:hypothetical protein
MIAAVKERLRFKKRNLYKISVFKAESIYKRL